MQATLTKDANRTPVAPKMQVWVKREVENDNIGPWTLSRVAVNANGFNYEINFTRLANTAEYISTEVWPFVYAYLPEKTDDFVLTANDAQFAGSEILLRGLIVTGHAVRDGTQTVMLTFRAVIGALSGFFTPHRMPNLLREVECGLSTRTLNDVIIPALNIAATDPITLFDDNEYRIMSFVEQLKENKKDIEFYAELLTRFIAARDREGLPLVETPRALQNYTEVERFLAAEREQALDGQVASERQAGPEVKHIAGG